MTTINIPITGLTAPLWGYSDPVGLRWTGSLDGPRCIKYGFAVPTDKSIHLAAVVSDEECSRFTTETSSALTLLAAGTANIETGQAGREFRESLFLPKLN